MSICKAKVQTHFAIIPNVTAQDSHLSFEARGVLSLMLSMPDDWIIRKEWLIKQSPNCGRDKMTRILKELIDHGYMKKEVNRENGRLNGVKWLVYAEPVSGGLKTSRTENQSSDKSNTTNKQLYKETDSQRNITDIFHSEKRIPLEDILHEHGLTYCKRAIEELELINEQRYTTQSYTGALTINEWLSCEEAMRSVDEFDVAYFTWWMETRSKSMRKSPSLPNMLCDMGESTFAEFYDSTFMQEWD